jgi:hypothetical protein
MKVFYRSTVKGSLSFYLKLCQENFPGRAGTAIPKATRPLPAILILKNRNHQRIAAATQLPQDLSESYPSR